MTCVFSKKRKERMDQMTDDNITDRQVRRGWRVSAILLLLFLAVAGVLVFRRPASWRDNGAGQAPSQTAHGLTAERPAAAAQPSTDLKPGARKPEFPSSSMPYAFPPAPGGATGESPSSPRMTILSAEGGTTRLKFVTGPYRLRTLQVDGRTHTAVEYRAGRLKKSGFPLLPAFRREFKVNGDSPRLAILSASYTSVFCPSPLVASGFNERGADASAGPHDGTPSSSIPVVYPSRWARLTDSYKIREHCGVGVIVHPFRYDAQNQELQILETLEFEISDDGASRRAGLAPRTYDSLEITRYLEATFLNSGRGTASLETTSGTSDATSVETQSAGSLPPHSPIGHALIIYPDGWGGSLSAFTEWKQQRGFTVSTASYPADTGSTAAGIQAYVQQQYQESSVTHLVLVGDAPDVPVYQMSPHPSDTMYTLVSGDDLYHDLFVSRVAASNADAALYQLSKMVDYEKDPLGTAEQTWYERAAFVASDEGAEKSAFGMDDRDLLDVERMDFLNAGFTHVDQIYDPGATDESVTLAWNEGRSVFYYLGHGSETQWNTSGFNVQDAGMLSNGRSLPFVLNGNCKNGNFTLSTGQCLAEAMMSAGAVDQPAGGIGVVAATTNMDWDPPIVMLQAFTDFITGNRSMSAGGMTFFSIQAAMDYCYATPDEGVAAAEKIMQQTHLLGDCTLGIRTRQPFALQVEHPEAVVLGEPFAVSVTSDGKAVPDAAVCLFRQSALQVVGVTDATGSAVVDPGLVGPDSVTLTVYERNAVPYQAELAVVGGALVIYSTATLPTAFLGETFAFQHQAAGGTAPYTWSITGGQAEWMALDPETGTLTGTPIQAGTIQYQLQVADAAGDVAQQTVTLTVGMPVSFTDTALPSATVAEAFAAQLQAEGSFEPFSFSLVDGTGLPDSMTLNADGTLYGTPYQAGAYTFTAGVEDQTGRSDQKDFTLTVEPSATITVVTDPVLAPVTVETQYDWQFEAVGGTGTGYAWMVVDGSLPAGLVLELGGRLAGEPLEAGTYQFAVEVTDDAVPPHSGRQDCTLHVSMPVHFPTTTLPAAVVGSLYNIMIPVEGTDGPFTFAEIDPSEFRVTTGVNDFTTSGLKQTAWLSDEQEWTLDFDFPFTFCGTTYQSCRVSDNGYLVFGATSPDPKWEATAEQFEDHVMIAPFWTDLVLSSNYPDTGIYVDRQADTLTVRWRGRDYHDESEVVNFSVTLHSDGRIVFRYGQIATTNRVVVGVSGGAGTTSQIVYTHDWYPENPDPVTGWTDHDSVVFEPYLRLPDWLTLTVDGQLSGMPAEAGQPTFDLRVTDAAGNSAIDTFLLFVYPKISPDTDGDGTLANNEILAYVEEYHLGRVAHDDVVQAILQWQSDGTGPRSERDTQTVTLAQPANRPRTGTISILAVGLESDAALSQLVQGGFDVATVEDHRAIVYADQADEEALAEQGYVFQWLDSQYVSPTGSRADSDSMVPDGYRTYAQLTADLQALQAAYPEICRLTSIGNTVSGRDIWAVTLTDNPDLDEDEPEVAFVSTIHGDEPLGSELMLTLIEHLLSLYGTESAEGLRATSLLDNVELSIVPLMNPDGYEAQTRYNAGGVDLNRDFPDGVLNDIGSVYPAGSVSTASCQPETAALMEWSAQHSFAVAAVLHTGALVVAYPYGNNAEFASAYTATPDDDLYIALASGYANSNPQMASDSPFPGGITNAAAWYPAVGELPDWHYRFMGTLALTLELAEIKAPDSSLLAEFDSANRESLLLFAESALTGVRGTVVDSDTGQTLWARVTVVGRDRPVYTDSDAGDYHRGLPAGTYDLLFEAPDYQAMEVRDVTVQENATATRLDVALRAAGHRAIRRYKRIRYEQGAAEAVSVAVDFDDEALPAACIVSEILPDGWSYVAGSVVSTGGQTVTAPRIDGQTLSWLVWQEQRAQLQDDVLSYQVAVPDTTSASVQFEGTLETDGEEVLTGGESSWEVLGASEFILTLDAGWNLFSIPLLPADPGTDAVFAAATGELSVWQWTGERYTPATQILPKDGYWAFAENADQFLISGSAAESGIRRFAVGWNLFGPLEDDTVLSFQPSGSDAYGWNASKYITNTALAVGKGYWIYSPTAVDVNLATGTE